MLVNKINGELIPNPEIISLKAYQNLKKKDFWIPIYINEEHFFKNKEIFLDYFCLVKYGNKFSNEFNFKIECFFEVISNILKSMIKNISKNISLISQRFIICLFHIIFLYHELYFNYKKIYNKFINKILDDFVKEINNLNKEINNPIISNIINILILFLFKNDPNSKEMLHLENYLNKLKQRLYLKEFSSNINFEMNFEELFLNDLKKFNIFEQILENIISSHNVNNDKISKNFRKKIISKMYQNFKETYYNCSKEIKAKIDEIIFNNINFSDYFNISPNIFEEKVMENDLPESFYLLMSFFIIKNAINKPLIFNELRENYGVYLETDELIQEMKRNLKGNKKVSKINEFIGIYSRYIYDILVFEIYINSLKKNGSIKMDNNTEKIQNMNEDLNETNKFEINSISIQKVFDFELINDDYSSAITTNINSLICDNTSNDNNDECNFKYDNKNIFKEEEKEKKSDSNDSYSERNNENEDDYYEEDDEFIYDFGIHKFNNKMKKKLKKKLKKK